jgi:hypothetical protein
MNLSRRLAEHHAELADGGTLKSLEKLRVMMHFVSSVAAIVFFWRRCSTNDPVFPGKLV